MARPFTVRPDHFLFAATALCGLLMTGCGRQAPPRPPAPPYTGGITSDLDAARIQPARYMEVSASSALFAIRASELALERSGNTALRAAAQAIITDQRGISGQLAFAGRRLNLLPAATMMPLHQSMIDELGRSGDFDGSWRRQQSVVLGQMLALHREYARRGTSPTLRPVSAMAAPLLASDLDRINRL